MITHVSRALRSTKWCAAGPRLTPDQRSSANALYRIHGTNAPETIGQAVSSGCFRLVNDDVIDLYDRVPVGTHVIVRQD